MELAIFLLAVFLGNIILTRLWIALQERQKRGQPIRDYGPEIHTHKKGVPTAGGLPFLMVFLLGGAVWTSVTGSWSAEALFVTGATLGFALIGMLDDGLKFFQQHARGLPVRYKLLLQFLFCVMLGWWTWGGLPSLKLPFLSDAITLSPALALVFLMLVFISTVNAFNETDGLDGLLGGVTLIALGAYGVILWLQNEPTLLSIVFITIAALLGFLWWNGHPARVIMGDTGSFALGGLVGALALSTGTALLLPLIAFIPVLESLSVLIQIASFKLLKKRVFKIAPLHHHFEQAKGVDYKFYLPNQEWPETLITLRFWIIAAVGALVGLLAYR
jgi:phospho-N-acetylmuramoyl-pentapeptide-transferase